jgi:hypothetical protein
MGERVCEKHQGIEQGMLDEDSMVTGQPMMVLSDGEEGGV